MRGAALVALLAAPAGAADIDAELSPACRGAITEARYGAPTERYPHGVLGDVIEYGALVLRVSDTCSAATPPSDQITITLPQELVFEDLAPRLADMTGDGLPEVIVVESHKDLGARLVIWGLDDAKTLTRLGETPFIGRRFRWLAPVGAADFNGDGRMDVAFVDRPHLAKTLRVWSYGPDGLTQIAALAGVSNHRIGEDFISGGVRACGELPEMVVASADWSQVLSVTLTPDGPTVTALSPNQGPSSFDQALSC